MKNILMMTIPALPISAPVFSQGISFESGSRAMAGSKAKAAGKIVFVDVHTAWCGPCKLMNDGIFPQQAVGEYFNANFINLKIDAEKGEGVEFSRKYNISSYPTFLFLDPEGKIVYRFEGSRSADKFIAEGRKATELSSLAPQLAQYAKEYEGGNRDVADVELYDRLADYTLGLDPGADKSLRNKLTSSILKSMSTAFRRVIRDDDLPLFEELLALKARFWGSDSAISAMMGGGIAYLPEEQLRMNFYSVNKMDDEFRRTLEDYMAKLEMNVSLDSLRKKEADTDEFVEEVRMKAVEENDVAALEAAGRIRSMINLFDGTKYKALSSFLMQAIGHYMNTGSGDKESDRRRYAGWTTYAYGIERSLSSAWDASDFLESVSESSLAMEILIEAERIASENTSGEIKESDLERVRKRLKDQFDISVRSRRRQNGAIGSYCGPPRRATEDCQSCSQD